MLEILLLIIIFLISTVLKLNFKEVLYHSKKERFTINIIIFVIMMSWETISRITGAWLFPGPGYIGIYIFELPLELYMFYIILPDFVFTVYELIRHTLGKSYIKK